MTGMKKVLSRIGNGNTIDTLARELNMNRSILLAMIKFMVDEGYLEITSMQCSCSGSNCSEKCCDSETKIYALTSKGERFIS